MMKCAIYVYALCLSSVLAAPAAFPAQNQITSDEDALRALTKLYEIDIQTKPEDGSVNGIRIRRNKGTQGALPAESEEYLLPELDIKKINDQMLSVNGLRIKRGDLSDLSDVELEKEIAAEAGLPDQDAADDRSRRSGSGVDSLLGFIIGKVTQKFGAIASASSGIAGASSGHSGHSTQDSYGPPVHQSYDDKNFNFWEFKKAILNTLLQAVKAIKGGIIALGGQVVKAKGHLISTAGKIVVTKGEAISGFGRQIAANAILTPPAGHGHTGFAVAAVDHISDNGPYPATGYPAPSYGPPSSYVPTAPATGYGAPSHGYNKRASPQHFAPPQQVPSGGVQAGLLLLKPIPGAAQQSQYIHPRGVKTYSTSGRDSYSSPSLKQPVQDPIPQGAFHSRDLSTSQSELQPLQVQDIIQHAQARSYFIRY